jgi:hypothetical protein
MRGEGRREEEGLGGGRGRGRTCVGVDVFEDGVGGGRGRGGGGGTTGDALKHRLGGHSRKTKTGKEGGVRNGRCGFHVFLRGYSTVRTSTVEDR